MVFFDLNFAIWGVEIMSDYTVLFPSYTIGKNAYTKIGDICSRYGRKIVVIGGPTALTKAKNKIMAAIKDTQLEIVDCLLFGGEASYENVERLQSMCAVQSADMIFAVGGGKSIDTCKVLAHSIKKPFFTFPTIASNCACLTSLGVVYHPNGHFRELSFSKVPPIHAFIDTEIAAAAPSNFLWAGMGDTIAKYHEASISARGAQLSHSDAIGVTISRMCAEPIYKYGEQALADNKASIASDAFTEVVLAIVVSTGMVSNFVVQDFNGHIAHALFCTITMLPQIEEKHLHGEVVMYGVLVLLMCDNQQDELARAYQFCKSVGLPTKMADIDVTLEEMDRVLVETEKSQELVQSPYKVTKEMLHEAIVKLEKYHK